jgi:thiamine transporter
MRFLNLRLMVEIAVMLGLAVVLGMIKIYQAPWGGSVSLEMLPLFIVAYRWGLGPGLIAGLVYGLLNLSLDGMRFIVHPIQLLLDYPVAFALVGLAGLFPGRYWLGTITGSLARLASHVVSGAIFFGAFAPEGQNVWVYSLIYNSSYILPEMVISGLLIWLIAKRTRHLGLLKRQDNSKIF